MAIDLVSKVVTVLVWPWTA